MTSPASLSPRRPLRPRLGPREALEIGPGTYVLRPAEPARLNTWKRWRRLGRYAALAAGAEHRLRCMQCQGLHYLCQLHFAHYPGAPKRLSGDSRASIFATGSGRIAERPEDLDELQHGRFICANCHALETSAQQLGEGWLDDFRFSTTDAQRRWLAARNAGAPSSPAHQVPLVQPLRPGQ